MIFPAPQIHEDIGLQRDTLEEALSVQITQQWQTYRAGRANVPVLRALFAVRKAARETYHATIDRRYGVTR